MNKKAKLEKKIKAFLYDHLVLKSILETLKYLFFAVAGAAIFAIGYTTFVSPYIGTFKITTGGVSGISQIIVKVLEILGINDDHNRFQSLFYSLLNVPIMIFSFFFIGKKFTIFTAINVFLSSVFISLFSVEGGLAETLATAKVASTDTYWLDSILIRVIFAGLCTGVSSALAFVGNISCGGIDVITYYLSNKKSTSVGKYSIIVNSAILLIFSILSIVSDPTNSWAAGAFSIIYSTFYLLVCSLVIDVINLRNKKVRIEAVTNVKNLGDILISVFPHGLTRFNAEGVYTKQEKYVFVMEVSSNEYKKVIATIKEIDKNAFVTVLSVVQVYGNFFSRPVE